MSRRTVVRRVALLVFGVNLALAVGKGFVWLETGSLAIKGEAVNSLADSLYSLIILAGIYLTTRPPDLEHPHGHERIEPFVSLLVALSIFAAGGLVLWQSTQAIISGTMTAQIGPIAIGILLLTGIVKYGLYRYCLRIGEERNSPAIVATALDNRNDILTAGAALAGVVGARAGAPILDPIAGAIVSLGIFYTGWEVVRDNIDYLIGRAPPENLRSEIIETALAHPDVRGAHDVVAHYVGPEVDVSLHIEVEGDRTIREAHQIETEVVQSIQELPAIDDVFVHIDPKELGEWKEDETVSIFVSDSNEGRSGSGTVPDEDSHER
ncbi:MAG: cation diffusion facilitator family transporter [Halobacteriales archaeon]